MTFVIACFILSEYWQELHNAEICQEFECELARLPYADFNSILYPKPFNNFKVVLILG